MIDNSAAPHPKNSSSVNRFIFFCLLSIKNGLIKKTLFKLIFARLVRIIVERESRRGEVRDVPWEQCDQIRRNFAYLANFWQFFSRLIHYLAKIMNKFWPFFLLGYISLLQMAQYWTKNLTIWSHCLGDQFLLVWASCSTQSRRLLLLLW